MTLRTRLLLGYGYLIALLLLSVGTAAFNSQRVARNVQVVVQNNLVSLGAAVTMLHQIERQDSATLVGLMQRSEPTEMTAAEEDFEKAIAQARSVAMSDDERAMLKNLQENYEVYRKARDELLRSIPEDAYAAYHETVFRVFEELKRDVNQYLEAKKTALGDANIEASQSAIEAAVLLGVLVTVALLSLGPLSRSLQRDVLGRLSEVGSVTEAIASGDRRRRVRDFYQDELGQVARQLNAALDRQQELESQMQGRLLEQRRALVGLMKQWPMPAALIGIDGELVASTLSENDEAELDRLTPRVRMAAKVLMTRRFVRAEELSADIKASDGVRVVQMRALASGDNQIAGWLASFVDPRVGVLAPRGPGDPAPGDEASESDKSEPLTSDEPASDANDEVVSDANGEAAGDAGPRIAAAGESEPDDEQRSG
ncbi:methyl-accepting chemotaxis protein [Nannocystis sp. SCPEA4]|uniref:MCP four helix bundle domain-containing protein n=1 Tax=Nannocystis sp. SCPEA4 TaxID=2996787 RepID=UPI00226FD98F|nr:methyl-accepting chemotaxis protein [Nannocystis sp. SCPEA4]MCY1058383.1 methyl-accepting chemotaxis protein [Nannocystis sp. SCPEA4]